jgi:hypothetical protein
MSKIFRLPSEQMEQVVHEASTALGPLYSSIERALIEQENNSVLLLLPREGFVLGADVLQFSRGALDDQATIEFWGLKLKLAPCIDNGIEKTWIKKTYLWARMLEVAGEETEVVFKEAAEPVEGFFRLASFKQIPRQEFRGHEVLLCAVGPNAEQALLAALLTHENFDPAEWDEDGYYLGPSE